MESEADLNIIYIAIHIVIHNEYHIIIKKTEHNIVYKGISIEIIYMVHINIIAYIADITAINNLIT